METRSRTCKPAVEPRREITKRRYVLQAIAIANICIAMPANAIITRDDIPDERYRNFGESLRGYIVQLNLPGSKAGSTPKLYNGMGTLIAPRWVITAAHASDRFEAGKPNSIDLATHYVYVNGRGYRIEKAFVHPGYTSPKGNGSGTDGIDDDIALLKLTSDVKDGKFACLYEGNDELDKMAVVAGMGLPGTGAGGTSKPDGALRGATVLVDKVAPNILSWNFRPPGDPRATALEGISGPGDSGGPAFISNKSGELCVAGISSTQSNTGTNSVYGVTEHYTRVSSHLAWLKKVMEGNP